MARPERVLRGRGRARPAGVAGRGRRGRGRARRGRARPRADAGGEPWAAAGRGGRQRCVRAGGSRAIFIWPYRAMDQDAALPRQDGWHGSALPRQRSADRVAATSAMCRATMHGATQAFGRARAIGAAKSVSFLKKPTVLDLKLVFKKC